MGLFSRLRKAVGQFVKAIGERLIGEEELSQEPIREDKELQLLKDRMRGTINEANQLIDSLTGLDLADYANIPTQRFDIEDLETKEEVIRESMRANAFIQNTSIEDASMRKRAEIGSEAVKNFKEAGIDLYKGKGDEFTTEFWSAVDRIKEEDSIGARLAAAQYSRDTAYGYAFQIWEESGHDMQSLKNAITDFLDDVTSMHARDFKPESGFANFEGEGMYF